MKVKDLEMKVAFRRESGTQREKAASRRQLGFIEEKRLHKGEKMSLRIDNRRKSVICGI